jgi:hypothetical protein
MGRVSSNAAKGRQSGEEHMNIPEIKGYANVKGIGLVAILSEDVGGMTFVARWVNTQALTDVVEHLIDDLPEKNT